MHICFERFISFLNELPAWVCASDRTLTTCDTRAGDERTKRKKTTKIVCVWIETREKKTAAAHYDFIHKKSSLTHNQSRSMCVREPEWAWVLSLFVCVSVRGAEMWWFFFLALRASELRARDNLLLYMKFKNWIIWTVRDMAVWLMCIRTKWHLPHSRRQ